MFPDKRAQFCSQMLSQSSSSRTALSSGVLAALERVHVSLRKALSAAPCVSPASLHSLAERLADDGLLVTLRSGLGVGIESRDYLSNLRHSFLICQDGSSGLCVIVDPFFREQFKVAGMLPSSAYCCAVANLPDCFVGTIGTVNALVCLLIGTLFQESAALGLELPPWRTKQAHLSKWLPRRFADLVFAPPSFVSLHPALRSSVHGDVLSSSPNSVHSWPSLSRSDSDVASSGSSSSGACGSDASSSISATTTAATQRASLGQLPRTVISGFTVLTTLPGTASSPPCCQGTTTNKFNAAAPACRATARSALTEQLVSASALSRAVKAEAKDHCRACLIKLQQQQQQQQQQLEFQNQAPSAPMAPTAATPTVIAATSCGSTCSGSGSLKSLSAVRSGSVIAHGDVVRSLVVSSVNRRAGGGAGFGPGGLKRGGAGGSCSTSCNLKLAPTTLKMLPRVYTVKLATVGGY